MDIESIFWINIFYVWIVLPVFSFLATIDIRWAAWFPYFFIFQAIVHVILGFIGKQFLNPGMFTAWFVHVPWAIWTIFRLMGSNIISNPIWNFYLVIGLIINATLPVVG